MKLFHIQGSDVWQPRKHGCHMMDTYHWYQVCPTALLMTLFRPIVVVIKRCLILIQSVIQCIGICLDINSHKRPPLLVWFGRRKIWLVNHIKVRIISVDRHQLQVRVRWMCTFHAISLSTCVTMALAAGQHRSTSRAASQPDRRSRDKK